MMPHVSPMLPPAYCATELASEPHAHEERGEAHGRELRHHREAHRREAKLAERREEVAEKQPDAADARRVALASRATDSGLRHAGGAPAAVRSARRRSLHPPGERHRPRRARPRRRRAPSPRRRRTESRSPAARTRGHGHRRVRRDAWRVLRLERADLVGEGLRDGALEQVVDDVPREHAAHLEPVLARPVREAPRVVVADDHDARRRAPLSGSPTAPTRAPALGDRAVLDAGARRPSRANESVMNTIAASIFIGVEGSRPRSPSHVQSARERPARRRR